MTSYGPTQFLLNMRKVVGNVPNMNALRHAVHSDNFEGAQRRAMKLLGNVTQNRSNTTHAKSAAVAKHWARYQNWYRRQHFGRSAQPNSRKRKRTAGLANLHNSTILAHIIPHLSPQNIVRAGATSKAVGRAFRADRMTELFNLLGIVKFVFSGRTQRAIFADIRSAFGSKYTFETDPEFPYYLGVRGKHIVAEVEARNGRLWRRRVDFYMLEPRQSNNSIMNRINNVNPRFKLTSVFVMIQHKPNTAIRLYKKSANNTTMATIANVVRKHLNGQ